LTTLISQEKLSKKIGVFGQKFDFPNSVVIQLQFDQIENKTIFKLSFCGLDFWIFFKRTFVVWKFSLFI